MTFLKDGKHEVPAKLIVHAKLIVLAAKLTTATTHDAYSGIKMKEG